MVSVANQLLSHASLYFRRDPLGQQGGEGPNCYQARPKQSLSRSGFMWERKHRRVETRWSHATRPLSLGTVCLLLTHPGAGKVWDGAERPDLWHARHTLSYRRLLVRDDSHTDPVQNFHNSVCSTKPFLSLQNQLSREEVTQHRSLGIWLPWDTDKICCNISLETIPVSEYRSILALWVHERMVLTRITYDRNQSAHFRQHYTQDGY